MSPLDQEIAEVLADNRRLRILLDERDQENHDLRAEADDLRARLTVLQALTGC